MDFIPHLEELRRRLLVCIGAFFIASLISYFFSHAILDFLTHPLQETPHNAQLIFQRPYEAFLIHIKVAAFSGFLISSPLLLFQAWFFIMPALYEKEKKVFLPVILISIALFWVGVILAYTLAVPWTLQFLLGFQTETMKPLLSVGSYFSFLIGMMIAFGVLFDFPVFMVGLVELGLLHTSALVRSRKIIVVLIFLAAAILTPSPDPLSQLALALPLILLFEISLRIAAYREKRRGLDA
jgi:sec-independent protein translocase protein TatC